jgi:hypothetical protein
MKVTITPEPEEFRPFCITLEIESLAEARALYCVANHYSINTALQKAGMTGLYPVLTAPLGSVPGVGDLFENFARQLQAILTMQKI